MGSWARTIVLLLVVVLNVQSIRAFAHSADILASLTLEAIAPDGQRLARVELRDFYGTAISGAALSIAAGQSDGEPIRPVDLVEEMPGRYIGQLDAGSSERTRFRLEAVLPDGPWVGERSVHTGPAAGQIRNLAIALSHRDAPAITPVGWVVIAGFIGAMVLTAIMGTGLLLDRVRNRIRKMEWSIGAE